MSVDRILHLTIVDFVDRHIGAFVECVGTISVLDGPRNCSTKGEVKRLIEGMSFVLPRIESFENLAGSSALFLFLCSF